jgi:fumarate hydratase class II
MKEGFRTETDSLGEVQVPADKLWGAETQRSLQAFQIGDERMPRQMIGAYALVKKAAASVNHRDGLLADGQHALICQAADELLAGDHDDMFPLRVWMSGSGTQFNMNVNEVIANRCCQLAGTALGSKRPVHPNDHVNMAQSTNDTFPSAMSIAAVQAIRGSLLPAVGELRDGLDGKAGEWRDIVKIGRTHLQDAVPLTLGQEVSGFVALLDAGVADLGNAVAGACALALGGTAVGTGLNARPGFGEDAAAEIARMTGLPFVSAANKFAVQGSHDALVRLSGALKALATSLYKIANDIRLLACGPRCGIHELELPANEPGSSIMPGKVNPTQCEALAMIAVQVMANDVAVTLGGGGGHLQMNAYKPLILRNVLHSVRILADGCTSFHRFLVAGIRPDVRRIRWFVERSLMLVTALGPVIGYDKAAHVAHHAVANDLTLREAALRLGYVAAADFDRIVDPARMTRPDLPNP